jgi:hypothetical protein
MREDLDGPVLHRDKAKQRRPPPLPEAIFCRQVFVAFNRLGTFTPLVELSLVQPEQ